MADYFISYTSSDRVEAQWIAQELLALGHKAYVHEWEIAAGEDIAAWMQDRHGTADHVLCVVSEAYLKAPYSTWERNAALWKAVKDRPGFVLFVVMKPCALPTLLAHFKRCELHGLPEEAARTRLREYVAKPGPPPGHISLPTQVIAEANITIRVPAHFMGRADAVEIIEKALSRHEHRAAILAVQGTALHGMRGVGKTVLAAAYAQLYRSHYRATWWIRAEFNSTIRADLAALGFRLGWVAADERDEQAVAATVLDRLQHEGEGILLIYDNARDAASLRPLLPRGGSAHVLITSNDHAWRRIVDPVEIRSWPEEIGADFLVARVGRPEDRAGALALSKVLAGLPLAHEQAAAFCEHLGVSFDDYRQRLEASPITMLDDTDFAADDYQLTVARTFKLAIEEAAKLHPAAEALIIHAALLAPEAIPRFFFSEGRELLSEPLVSALAGDGLLKAIAALRTFALIELESVPDERVPATKTESIRLHHLIRAVAGAQSIGAARFAAFRGLIAAMEHFYPAEIYNDPRVWLRARRLDPIAIALTESPDIQPEHLDIHFSVLLNGLAAYRHAGLASHSAAQALFERALAINKKAHGAEHHFTATILNNLAGVLVDQGNFAAAHTHYKCALVITEKLYGPHHSETASRLHNIANLLLREKKFEEARPLCERALKIRKKTLEPDHPLIASSLNNLAMIFQRQSNFAAARPLHECALRIRERALGPDHPDTAESLNNLAGLLFEQGDFAAARPLLERVRAIQERVFGPDHPYTANSLNNLAGVLCEQGNFAAARPLLERALAINVKALGLDHPHTVQSLNNLAGLTQASG